VATQERFKSARAAERANAGEMPLHGLTVIDAGVLFAGPMIATYMADFGADVIKVEHPAGDPLRSLAWHKDGESLWWAFANRNKRAISLDLSTGVGQGLMKELVGGADVLIESFRPGTMERWGLDWDRLRAINPRLIFVRTSGFGQTGPYRRRPGFGTIAEAMSGFAYMNGHPDGPPTLPPFALGDGVAALFGVFATMFALYHRDAHSTGQGQVIDLSIFEPLFMLLGPHAVVYDQLGVVQGRTGNATDWTAPRNAYLTKDGRWVALSASSQRIAERVVRVVGREDLLAEPWFSDHVGRVAHNDELDAAIGGWIEARTLEQVLGAFNESEAAVGPVYSIDQIFTDPQYLARGSITSVSDDRLGEVRIQSVVPVLSETPGRIDHLGPARGEHNREIFVDRLGHSEEELIRWRREGAI
jgi:crotonobetainyl-CoA:carnitine CoA-transferase CaiB-like acyl-CoA transferase